MEKPCRLWKRIVFQNSQTYTYLNSLTLLGGKCKWHMRSLKDGSRSNTDLTQVLGVFQVEFCIFFASSIVWPLSFSQSHFCWLSVDHYHEILKSHFCWLSVDHYHEILKSNFCWLSAEHYHEIPKHSKALAENGICPKLPGLEKSTSLFPILLRQKEKEQQNPPMTSATLSVLTLSLPCMLCWLGNKVNKFESLKLFLLLFFAAPVGERICIKMHSTESRLVTGPRVHISTLETFTGLGQWWG